VLAHLGSLIEVQTEWTVLDLLEAHAALDAKAEILSTIASQVAEQLQGGPA